MVDPGARRLTTERPGATRSGLNHPSGLVGPTALNDGTVSSLLVAVPWSLEAPPVMTSGSSPGVRMVPLKGPAFPADTTTATPLRQAASTALSRGFITVEAKGWAPSDMLSTPMLSATRCPTTQLTPVITVARSVWPDTPATLTATRLAPGASPMYCPPEDAPLAATRPATKVPW